ncbi:carboxymuconolactone decarboxylase family protein [uncultured Paludibaculum sp.]|uniref:carboxymuconolactone decarboxylase family protein n=1 Tax=uncultured Paludibaculum sp. TaxID=1765020 RepID=UPI002AAA87C0|nr:carboxymuconolactone decarboxylase family protein [uncultured Paludibaculum sp.]
MKERMNYVKAAPEVYKAMLGVHQQLEQSGLDKRLLDLVYLRASQISRCAFCIDMHWKDLRALGVPEQDLYMLNAWHEWPAFTARERAALQWTESVTLLTEGFVPDTVYDAARAEFSEAELARLTMAVAAINGWNRLSVAFRRTAGAYKPASATAHVSA